MTTLHSSFQYACLLSDSSQTKTQQEVIANDHIGLSRGLSESRRQALLIPFGEKSKRGRPRKATKALLIS